MSILRSHCFPRVRSAIFALSLSLSRSLAVASLQGVAAALPVLDPFVLFARIVFVRLPRPGGFCCCCCCCRRRRRRRRTGFSTGFSTGARLRDDLLRRSFAVALFAGRKLWARRFRRGRCPALDLRRPISWRSRSQMESNRMIRFTWFECFVFGPVRSRLVSIPIDSISFSMFGRARTLWYLSFPN